MINLERVGFNLKNFDMAIVFKDFTREVRAGWWCWRVGRSGQRWAGGCGRGT